MLAAGCREPPAVGFFSFTVPQRWLSVLVFPVKAHTGRSFGLWKTLCSLKMMLIIIELTKPHRLARCLFGLDSFWCPTQYPRVQLLFIPNELPFSFCSFSAASINGAPCWARVLHCHYFPSTECWSLTKGGEITDRKLVLLYTVTVPPNWQGETWDGNFLNGSVKY